MRLMDGPGGLGEGALGIGGFGPIVRGLAHLPLVTLCHCARCKHMYISTFHVYVE